MRTTVDVPDDLMRRAKATAALRGMKLKDLIADFIAQGLNAGTDARTTASQRSPLPSFIPHSGRTIKSLTNADVEALLFEDIAND